MAARLERTSAQALAALAAFDTGLLGKPTLSHAARLDAMAKALQTADQVAEKERQRRTVVRCHAQQCGDELLCGRCGLTWAVDDQDRPSCSPIERRVTLRREDDR